jgi:hypothetical protein
MVFQLAKHRMGDLHLSVSEEQKAAKSTKERPKIAMA